MSQTKISSYFRSERNEEKDKDQERKQDRLHGEDDAGNTNPMVGKRKAQFSGKMAERTHVDKI